MRSLLGPLVEPHYATVAPHPLVPSQSVVTVRQRYRELIDPQFFDGDSPVANTRSVSVARDTGPFIHSQMCTFVAQSLRLYESHGLLPDISRPGNLMIHDSSLLIIDGEPIGSSSPETQLLIMQRLESLNNVLAT